MKTKVLFLIPVIMLLQMATCSDAISQNSKISVSGDKYWDEQFGSPGMSNDVNCFLKKDGLIYAGGEYKLAGGNYINRIASWDGTSWTQVGFGFDENAVFTLEDFNNEIYAGGIFYHSNGQDMLYFAKYNGTEWVQPGSAIDLQVNCLASSDDMLYLGGSMRSTAGIELNGIAAWDGSQFHSLAGGMWKQYEPGPFLGDIKFIGNNLYAGGDFAKAGGAEGADALNIAKWDGSSWSALGAGINCEGCIVNSLAVIGNDLYVAGGFSVAGGVAVNNIAKWDGTQWSALGSGTNGAVFATAVIGDKLYVGGYFTGAGGVSAENIAMWDGNQWSALGSGTNHWVSGLYADGDILYVGGRFTTAGNKASNKIARWNTALSVEDHQSETDILVYPNPVSSVVSLHSAVFIRQSSVVEIYDLNGKKLLEKNISAGTENIEIDVSNLQSGIYFCKISTDENSMTKKIIIQK